MRPSRGERRSDYLRAAEAEALECALSWGVGVPLTRGGRREEELLQVVDYNEDGDPVV